MKAWVCARARSSPKLFVLDQQFAAPEKVDRAGVAFEIDNVRLEGSERRATQTEDIKEVVPESLLFRTLRAVAGMLAREANGAFADFVPRKVGH